MRIYICIYIYIYVWLRTNGINTNGAAAKVINFDGLGKMVRPCTSGETKVG